MTQTASNLFTIAKTSGNIALDLPGDDDPAPVASLNFSGLTGKIIVNMDAGDNRVLVTSPV